jgi:hypothetical protein
MNGIKEKVIYANTCIGKSLKMYKEPHTKVYMHIYALLLNIWCRIPLQPHYEGKSLIYTLGSSAYPKVYQECTGHNVCASAERKFKIKIPYT